MNMPDDMYFKESEDLVGYKTVCVCVVVVVMMVVVVVECGDVRACVCVCVCVCEGEDKGALTGICECLSAGALARYWCSCTCQGEDMSDRT